MSEKNKYVIPYQYRGDHLVEATIKEISKSNVIGKEAENVLFQEYNKIGTTEKRKDEIKSILVNSNMRFVLDYCLHYINFPIHLCDMISAGKIGLLMSVDLFDYTKGIKFTSFAVWYIKSQVSKLLETNDLIQLPSHKKVKLNKLKKNIDEEDLSDEYKYLNQLTQPYLSFESPVNTDGDLKLSDIIEDENAENVNSEYIKNKTFSEIKEKIKSKLSEDEYLVISYLYNLNGAAVLGLREVGEILKKSHERVRQLKTSAIKKLKGSMELEKLSKVYMET